MTITRIPLRVDNAPKMEFVQGTLDRSKWLAAALALYAALSARGLQGDEEARAFAPVLLAEIARVKAALHHH